MDANKQALPNKRRFHRRTTGSTPMIALQLVLAFPVGIAAAWAFFGLQSQLGFLGCVPGWFGVMVLGNLMCRDSRYLRQAIRGSAFFAGFNTGMVHTMSVLHHPSGRASDIPTMLAITAGLVALSLLGLLYDRTLVKREQRSLGRPTV